MGKSRRVGLAALSVMAATVVPLTATGTSVGAVRSLTSPPIGTHLAELKGSDTVANDRFGDSTAALGAIAIVGATGHANKACRAYIFEA